MLPTARLRALPLALSLALPLLSACQAVGPNGMALSRAPAPSATAPTDSGYPREAPGVENPRVFPATVAGYRKTSVTLFEPGMKDYSVGYDDQDPATPNRVHLYFYQAPEPLAAMFEGTKVAIRVNSPTARLLTEFETRLSKNGRSYPARVATFSLEGNALGPKQLLYSKVLIVALPTPGHYFKLRQSGPIDTAGTIESHGQKLLDAIDWTYEAPQSAPTLRDLNAT